MTIGLLTFEIHLPQSRSLKDKRQVFRSLKDRIRARHNVALCELEDGADLWQRGSVAVVSVASHRDVLDQLFETIVSETERHIPGHLFETGREFVEGADGGPGGWNEELLVTHRRNERVAEEIRGVLAEAIREVRDPLVGFVTLTGVDLSPDLRQARVYVSRMGTEADRDAAVTALNHAGAFLRHAVATRARLRFTPALRFVSDATIERGSRVEAIIREIHADTDREAGDDPDASG